MGTNIPVWQGDYGYAIGFTLLDAQGNPFNLSSNTGITFFGQLLQVTKTTFSGAMTVLNATAGTCTYTVGNGNFALAGQYNAQIQVTFAAQVVTFGNIIVTVNPKIPF